MKLKNELPDAIKRLELIADKIAPYAAELKAGGDYSDFETRLAWDCLRAVYRSAELCAWYDRYACNDKHIDTLAKAALRHFYDCNA